MFLQKNKKPRFISSVFVLGASFLFVLSFLVFRENILAAPYDETVYQKGEFGTLTHEDWNNLLADFVNTWKPTSMTGPLGIGTGTPPIATKLDVGGKFIFSTGGILYNEDQVNPRFLSFSANVGSDALKVAGDLNTTQGVLKAGGIGNSYIMGNLSLGTTTASDRLTISGNINLPNYNAWSYIKNSAQYGRLRLGTGNSSGTYVDGIEISSAGGYVKLNHNTVITGNASVSNSATISNNLFVTSGNVGIGTTTVPAPLTIQQKDNANGFALYGNYDPTSYFKFFIGAEGANNPRFNTNRSLVFEASQNIYLRSTGSMLLNDSNTNNVYLVSGGGKVAIGTTTASSSARMRIIPSGSYSIDAGGGNIGGVGAPLAGSDVVNMDYLISSLASSTADIITQVATSSFWQGQLNGNIWSNNTGNVGIGTTDPGAYKLYVNGSSYLKGNILLGGANTKIIQSQAANYSLPTLGTRQSFLNVANNSVCRVTLSGSENSFYQPIVLDIYRGASGAPKIIRTSVKTHEHSYLLGFSSDDNGDIWVEKLVYNTARILNLSRLEELKGTCNILDGTATSAGVNTDQSVSGNWFSASSGSNSNIYYLPGNIGIGTTAPNKKMEIVGGLESFETVLLQIRSNSSTNNTASVLKFLNSTDSSSNNGSGEISVVRTNVVYGGDSDMLFRTAQGAALSEIMRLKSNGNVGIGTSSPSAKLAITGGTEDNIKINQGQIGGLDLTPIRNDNAVSKWYVDNNFAPKFGGASLWATSTAGTYNVGLGNVGIGTTTPADKLQVYGNAFLGKISGYPFKSLWSWDSDNTGYYSGIGYQKSDGTNQKLFAWWKDNVLETNINSVLNVATITNTFNGAAPNTGRTIGASISASGISYFNGGSVGIGTIAPISSVNGLDISSGGLGLIVGAENATNARTNNTIKYGRIASPHYINAEEPMIGMVMSSQSTSNILNLGGGTSMGNAATGILFYTAANNTTVTGLERMRITNAGNVAIGTTTATSTLVVSNLTTKVIDVQGGHIGGLNSTPLADDYAVPLGYLKNNYNASSTNFWGGSLGGNIWSNNAGSIGIGTTTPAVKLHVVGRPAIRWGYASSYATWYGQVGNYGYSEGQDSLGGVQFLSQRDSGSSSSAFYSFNTQIGANSSIARLVINYDGNVGIGTTNPQVKLDVSGVLASGMGVGNGEIRSYQSPLILPSDYGNYVSLKTSAGKSGIFRSNTDFFLYYDTNTGSTNIVSTISNQPIIFKNLSTELARITSGGNVIIGTTSPAAKLHVDGTGYFSNTVTVGTPTAPGHAATKSYVDGIVATSSDTAIGFWTKLSGKLYPTDTSLNVGIGTTDPSEKLESRGGNSNSLIYGALLSNADTTNTGGSMIGLGFAVNNITVPKAGVLFERTASYGLGNLYFSLNNVADNTTKASKADAKMTILNNGNVGIGTSSPSSPLHIYNSNFGLLSLDRPGFGTWIISPSSNHTTFSDNNALRFRFNGSDIFSLDSTGALTTNAGAYIGGAVGIGAINAAVKLNISGGNVFINDAAITAGTPNAAITKSYLDSSLGAYLPGSSRSYNSVVGDTGADDWYSVAQISDSTNSPATFSIKGYAHSSVLFSVVKGYQSVGAINILNYESGCNSGYKCIKGVRLTSDGTVQVKLGGGAITNISVTAFGAAAPVLYSTLNRETGSPALIDNVETLIRGMVRTSGPIHVNSGNSIFNGNVGIEANYKLMWSSNPGRSISMDSDASHNALLSAYGNIDFQTYNDATSNYSSKLIISKAGLVGIGTINPGAKLDVVGVGQFQYAALESEGEFLRIARTSTPTTRYSSLWARQSLVQANNYIGFRVYDGNSVDYLPVEMMRITGAGNVGIGTSSPSAKLAITGGTEDNIKINQGQIGGLDLTPIRNDNAVSKWYVDNNFAPKFGGASLWATSTAGTYNVGLGNVGIGTMNPQSDLHIGAGGLGYIDKTRLTLEPPQHTGGPWKFDVRDVSSGPSNLDITYGSSKKLTINSSGNVGIGTTSPLAKLQVVGGATGLALQVVGGATGLAFNYPLFLRSGNPSYGGGLRYDTNGLETLVMAVKNANTKILFATGFDIEASQGSANIVPATVGLAISNNNVGIGTTSPATKLHVYNGSFQVSDNSSPSTGLYINPAGVSSGATAVDFLNVGNSRPFNFRVGGVNTLFVSPNKVSIGTTTATTTLFVDGAGYFTNVVTVGTPTAPGHAATKNYVDSIAVPSSDPGTQSGFWTSGSNNSIYNNNSGNVGIGTNNPLAKLHVNGGVILKTTFVNNTNYTAQADDYIIAYSSISADRTVTLPSSLCTPGRFFVVMDQSGSANFSAKIIIDPEGSTPIVGQSTFMLSSPYNAVYVFCGNNAWFLL